MSGAFTSRAARSRPVSFADVEIRLTVNDDGSALIDLGSGGEIRESVSLDELEASEGVPALGSLVLHFDFYGRLAQIEVTDSVGSVLPPALLNESPPG